MEVTWARQNAILEIVVVYWCKRDFTMLFTTYQFISFLLNGNTVFPHCAFGNGRWPYVALWVFRFHARMYYNSRPFYIRYLHVIKTFENSDGDSTTRCIFYKYWQQSLSRLKWNRTKYSCRDMRAWRVLEMNFTTKRITNVHRLVTTMQATTGNCVATTISTW